MTNEERIEILEQQIAVLIKDRTRSVNEAWQEIKRMCSDACREEGGQFYLAKAYQMQSAISWLLRNRYKIERITDLPESEYENAVKLGRLLVDLTCRRRVQLHVVTPDQSDEQA